MTVLNTTSSFYQDFCADMCCVLGDEATFFKSVTTNQGIHTEKSTAPIGVFDSGMGGLSVLQHLVHALPNESFIYLADTKHVPYGERSFTEIEKLTQAAVAWLYSKGCKLVVVACNSASTHSLPNLRAFYGESLPIVGLVPALKPAVLATQTKKVAVLATKATLDGYLLNQVIDEIAKPATVSVSKYHLPSLVPWVESGMDSAHEAFQELSNLLHNIEQNNEDCLVLGCTHFPFFKDKIIQLMPSLKVMDSGSAIAKRVTTLLTRFELTQNIPDETRQKQEPQTQTSGHFLGIKVLFFTTKGCNNAENMIKQLFNREITSYSNYR